VYCRGHVTNVTYTTAWSRHSSDVIIQFIFPGAVTPSEDDRTVWEKLQDKIYDLLFGWQCPGEWYRFARLVELFVMDAFVDLFITLCIVGNTIFMAIDHADIDTALANVLNIGNNVCHSKTHVAHRIGCYL